MPAIQTTRLSRIPMVGNLGYPIALKEVRSLIRRGKYFWAQFFYLAVLAVGVVVIITLQMDQSTAPEEVSATVFTGFFIIQTFLVYLVFPAFAATSISGERVEKCFDLVITTDLKPAEIVWGKFIGVFGGCCYFLLVTLPILGTCILFGGKSVWDALESYAALLVQAALLTIYGIFVSTASHSNIRAILGTYALAFLFGGGAIGGTLALFDEMGTVSMQQVAATLSPVWVETITLTTIYAVITVFGLCFLGAVQRLMSPESNRAMPLRIFIFLATVVGVGLYFYIVELFLGTGQIKGWQDSMRVLTSIGIPCMVTCFLCALIFAASDVYTPLRVVREAGRRPWLYRLLWPFLPGGTRGFCYALLLMVVLMGSLELLGAWVFDLEQFTVEGLPGLASDNMLIVARLTWGPLFAGFFCYASLAFLLSALDVQGVLNLAIVVGCAILASCYATTFYAMELNPQWIHLYPLSLLVSLIEYYRAPAGGGVSQLMTCIYTHLGLGMAAFLGACFTMWRRKIPILRLERPGIV